MVKNEYNLNYSLLNLTKIKNGNYKLIATFVSNEGCSNITNFNLSIRLKEDFFILKLFFILTVIFLIILINCIYVKSIRTKIIFIFKIIFGITIQVPQTQETKYKGINKMEVINLDYIPLEFENCDEYEFPRNRLEIQQNNKPKGGNFGIVYIGKAYNLNQNKDYTPVAIKTLRDNAPTEEINALDEEIITLKKISSQGNHENVVKMLGCCTIQPPKLLILELVICGDLKNYLIDLRNEWSNKKKNNHFLFPDDVYITSTERTLSESSSNCMPSPTETESTIVYDDLDDCSLNLDTKKITPALSNVELQNFALQISKGMAFLENISVVHRDLAARNILINEMKILKISDFGMSRIGNYVHKNTGQQPLRWMAPESIENFICTSKSDVWSFGVVLWEIGTLGAFPYDNIPNDRILEYLLYNLKKDIRLMRPEICTDDLYSLMLKCWSINPNDRPTFQQIVDYLNGEKMKIYIDFKKLNPAYVFPPTCK